MDQHKYYRVRVYRDNESDKEIEGVRYSIEEIGNLVRVINEEVRRQTINTAIEGFVKDVIPNSSKSVFELEAYLDIKEEDLNN